VELFKTKSTKKLMNKKNRLIFLLLSSMFWVSEFPWGDLLAQANSAEGKNAIKFQRVYESLKSQIKTLAPEAVLDGTNNTLRVCVRMRAFTRAGQSKDGKRSSRSFEITGPEKSGFSVRSWLGTGKYNQPLARGRAPVFDRTKAVKDGEFFFTGVLIEFPELGCYVVTDIQFGDEADLDVLSKIYRTIEQGIKTEFKAK